MRERLRHVCWIGGASGAGKSTIARRIASRHGVQLYASDDTMSDHARRSPPGSCPRLERFMRMDLDERWVRRSPAEMLETFPWFGGEGFELLVEDLLRLPREPGVIAEGFRLLPSLVEPLLELPRQAVWLLPTPRFREAVFAKRGPTWGFLPRTCDPERALRNLLERDRLFTERLAEETGRLGLAAFEVDVGTTEDALAERVTTALGL